MVHFYWPLRLVGQAARSYQILVYAIDGLMTRPYAVLAEGWMPEFKDGLIRSDPNKEESSK
jgi:hypothetical protein